MKACQLFAWKSKPRLVDIPQRSPGTDEVLVKVGGNGLCHSDLHAVDELTGSPPHWILRSHSGLTTRRPAGLKPLEPAFATSPSGSHARSPIPD
jgi:hypothetical protein